MGSVRLIVLGFWLVVISKSVETQCIEGTVITKLRELYSMDSTAGDSKKERQAFCHTARQDPIIARYRDDVTKVCSVIVHMQVHESIENGCVSQPEKEICKFLAERQNYKKTCVTLLKCKCIDLDRQQAGITDEYMEGTFASVEILFAKLLDDQGKAKAMEQCLGTILLYQFYFSNQCRTAIRQGQDARLISLCNALIAHGYTMI